MTRKHFQAMADALRIARPLWPHTDIGRFSDPEAQAACDQWRHDVQAVADVFAADNGRFDRERFDRACGVS